MTVATSFVTEQGMVFSVDETPHELFGSLPMIPSPSSVSFSCLVIGVSRPLDCSVRSVTLSRFRMCDGDAATNYHRALFGPFLDGHRRIQNPMVLVGPSNVRVKYWAKLWTRLPAASPGLHALKNRQRGLPNTTLSPHDQTNDGLQHIVS